MIMRVPSPPQDLQKTQDGREEDAERIVRANRYVKVLAEESFNRVEDFIEKATRELDYYIRDDPEDIKVAEMIANKMEQCEKIRTSFSLLSCENGQRLNNPPRSTTPVSIDETQKESDVFGPPLLERRFDRNWQRRLKHIMSQPTAPTQGKKTPLPTPQGSQEENATQLSDRQPLTFGATPSKEGANGTNNKVANKGGKESADEHEHGKLKNAFKKKWKKLFKEKSQSQRPTEEKKSWWQFW
ncbi:unnamed protein product [Cylicocyclus nassatus]|uniref:Uncharacterized protein n=1 Tax=Cylicocyclus nassatus TaxID=53992 RepID=A0AA36HB07_CYLNA|nr:unnamed protein product [Cylicocyclus nassatus]